MSAHLPRAASWSLKPIALLAALGLAGLGSEWIALAASALTYPTVAAGEPANLAHHGGYVYATQAESGLLIIDARSGRIAGRRSSAGGRSVDDLAVSDGLLFALDARPPGSLAVYSLHDPAKPQLVAPPVSAAVGPFSGVSASGGLVVVSGGTSRLTARRYDVAGRLSAPVAEADLGRGQPDVLVAPGGRRVFVSTHYRGPRFGLEILDIGVADRLVPVASLPLPGAGFSPGGARPGNFPIASALLDSARLLVAHAAGVTVVDLVAAGGPAVAATVRVGGPAVSLDAVDNRAVVAVAGRAPSLVLLEFAGYRARVARRIPLVPGSAPLGVAFADSALVLATRRGGVQRFVQ